VKYSQGYLEEIGLESGRLGHSLVTPGDVAALAGIIKAVKARLKALGQSPLKAKV
jgi:coenzyme F420-reducing hydrogenase delta subunit